jgi:TonB family protein
MQADHGKLAAAARSRFLLGVLAICATWPLLLLGAEPVKPDAPVQQRQAPEAPDASPLKRTKTVVAQYPQLPLSHGIEGAVTLRFTVLPDGSTADIEVVNTESEAPFEDRAVQAISNSLFEENAIRALQQWRYAPLIRDGQPVAQSAMVRIRFAPCKDVKTAADALPSTYGDPLGAASMESLLRRDLDKALRGGLLSPTSPVGIAIGVVRDGDRRVFAFGKAQPDAIFEIGSITKTFTGLLLALAIEQGNVKSDTPVRELVPQGTVAKPASGGEITLLDLATQHSGLPHMPDNFQPKDYSNPYADFDSTRLYQFLREHGVAKPAQPQFLYSNLGFGLLGQALVNRANTDYATLVKRSVLEPLGMRETSIIFDANQQRRVIPGYDAACRLARAWDVTALAGAGGLRSTAGDMLTYLEANLRQRPADAVTTADGRALAAALARSQTLQADVADTRKIAYAWVYDAATETYSHDGGTGGYSSYAFFSPKRNYAGIVLVNLASTTRGNFAVVVGKHLAARFAGDKTISPRDQ